MRGCPGSRSMTVGALVRMVVGAYRAAGCHPSPTAIGTGCGQSGGVPGAEFPAIATRLANALRPSGVCYLSFKLGIGERIVDGRCFTDHTEASLCTAMRGTGLKLLETWTTGDVRIDRSGLQWLNAIAMRASTEWADEGHR